MMKHFLHRYSGNTQFEADYNGANYEEPWVSVTDGDASGRVNYNKTEKERLLGTPLTFKITSGGDIKWKAKDINWIMKIQYSKNNGDWTPIRSTTGGTSISVAANDVVKFKSTSFPIANSFSGTTAGFELEGNVMSLGGGESFASLTITSTSAFTGLFQSCTGLTDASKLLLPATTLATYCYQSMFQRCTSLTTAPELPATTLASNCYSAMFQGCTSLTTAPALPATTLASDCYSSMFNGCTSLTTAPELPATTLATWCYSGMFSGCTSLTTAPELPATTLVSSCYKEMFYGCSKLNYIKAMFTTTPGTDYTKSWVLGVAASGTFVKNSAATWNVTGFNGAPTGWAVETA